MQFVRNESNIADIKEAEYMRSLIVKQAATIDYLAMMTDVEIPSDEDSEVHNNEL